MITQQLMTYLEQCFSMPILPASVLMVILLFYSILVILGALDFDLDFDLDLDVDVEADIHSFSSVGFVALKYLNIGQVPIMVWLSVFGFAWWAISITLWETWDINSVDPNVTLLLLRNVGAAIVLTKLMTNPMKSFFETVSSMEPEDLIGHTCEITTVEVTTEFGQAKYASDGAPLLLDVKAREGVLSKGDSARIVDYCSDGKSYYVVVPSDPP